MPIRYKLLVNATVTGCIAAYMIGTTLFAQVHSTLDSDPRPVSSVTR